MTYSGYDISPRKPQTLSDTPLDARPDAPSHTRSGKTMTMQNDSNAPFKVNAKVSLTLKVWGRYGTQNRAKRTAVHSQNAPRTFIARKFLATSIPAVNGNSIRSSPPKKFIVSMVQPTPMLPYPEMSKTAKLV